MLSKDHRPNGCSVGQCRLIDKFKDRPNNHGTMAGASLAAALIYLDRSAELEEVARVFEGFLGNRDAYAGFRYGGPEDDLTWQADPATQVGINPLSATINGYDASGVLPDDQRRGGPFTWPPPKENYVYEALQGAVVLATILNNAGYTPFLWEDRAILRAYRWLRNVADYPPAGDDTFQLPLIEFHYGAQGWATERIRNGKNMGWTDWTHGQQQAATRPKPPRLIGSDRVTNNAE